MRKTVRVTYRHWKKPDVLLTVEGVEVPIDTRSDRIVIETKDGKYEDVIKSTIVSKELL